MVGGAPPPGPPLGHAHDTSYRTKVRDSSYCLPSALVDTFPAFKFSFFYFIQLVEVIMSLETPLKKKEVLLLSQYGKASLNRKRLRKLVGNKIKGGTLFGKLGDQAQFENYYTILLRLPL